MSDWIFCDLDGTLLRKDKSISNFTIRILEEVSQLGHRLVFATARPPRSVRELLPAQFHHHWFLCGNGARIQQGDRVLKDAVVPTALVEAVVDAVVREAPGCIYAWEAPDGLTASGDLSPFALPATYRIVAGLRTPHVPVNKILVCLRPGAEARIRAALPAGLNVVTTDGGGLLQIMPTGVSKGAAVAELLAAEGSEVGHTLCFGDDHNDLSMFEACTWPVALENSVDGLKQRARALTASHDDDGVARYLAARYGLSEKAARASRPVYRTLTEVTSEFVQLTDELDRELWGKKGVAQGAYDGFNRLDGIRDVVLAYVGDKAVGCASFKRHDAATAEVKRVFVRPEHRGCGLSKGLMGALELWARSQGVQALLVETSRTFVEAIGLYRALGYEPVANFPPYEGMDDSVCFRKAWEP